MEMFDPVYMIRGGEFGTNFSVKLLMCVAAAVLAAWDGVRHKRWDYARVLFVGALTWTAVEAVMQLTGMRAMHTQLLFGASVPLPLALVLQGTAEGATIAVMGVFIGDRILHARTRIWAVLALVAVCLVAAALTLLKDPTAVAVNALPPSRRNMAAVPALAFLAVMMGINAWFWIRCRAHRRRAVAMFGVMVTFAAIWTVAEVLAGSRWIEVDGFAPGDFAHTTAPLAWAALTYDVVVEIALAYVPFFAIPALLGHVTEWPIRPASG